MMDLPPPSRILSILLQTPFDHTARDESLLAQIGITSADLHLDDQHRLLYMRSSSFYDPDDYDRYFEEEARLQGLFESCVEEVKNAWGPADYLNLHLIEHEFEADPPRFDHDMYWMGGMALAYWRHGQLIA